MHRVGVVALGTLGAVIFAVVLIETTTVNTTLEVLKIAATLGGAALVYASARRTIANSERTAAERLGHERDENAKQRLFEPRATTYLKASALLQKTYRTFLVWNPSPANDEEPPARGAFDEEAAAIRNEINVYGSEQASDDFNNAYDVCGERTSDREEQAGKRTSINRFNNTVREDLLHLRPTGRIESRPEGVWTRSEDRG